MPRDELPSDPDALEKWRNMPQNQPSKQAMPPATGGTRWAWFFVIALGALVIIALLAGGLPI